MKENDLNEFIKICKLTQEQLLNKLYIRALKNNSKNNIFKTAKYLYIKGNLPVLLVAHLDTVHKKIPNEFWFNLEKTKIMASEGIGGDDRCGVFILNKFISSNYHPHILFTTDEETGCYGAQQFCDDFNIIDVNCIIEVDRRGFNDVISYEDENEDLTKIFEKLGFKHSYGSFTDISILSPHFGISGVNLSCGYYNPHTNEEYVVLDEILNTYYKLIEFFKSETNYSTKFLYKSTPFIYQNIYSRQVGAHMCECCLKKIGNYDEFYLTPDGYLCDECFEKHEYLYTTCPSCGEIMYADIPYCEYCGYDGIDNGGEEYE